MCRASLYVFAFRLENPSCADSDAFFSTGVRQSRNCSRAARQARQALWISSWIRVRASCIVSLQQSKRSWRVCQAVLTLVRCCKLDFASFFSSLGRAAAVLVQTDSSASRKDYKHAFAFLTSSVQRCRPSHCSTKGISVVVFPLRAKGF